MSVGASWCGTMGSHDQGQGCFEQRRGRLGVSETVGNLLEISDGGLKQPLNRLPAVGTRSETVGNPQVALFRPHGISRDVEVSTSRVHGTS